MTRFVSKQTERVDLGDGDWVHLRQLNYGDRRAIEGALVSARIRDNTIFMNKVPDNLAGNVELLYRSLAGWGGPGFGCSCTDLPHAPSCGVAPITHENIEQLDTTGDRLLGIIAARQEAQALPKVPSTNSSTGSEGEASVSHLSPETSS